MKHTISRITHGRMEVEYKWPTKETTLVVEMVMFMSLPMLLERGRKPKKNGDGHLNMLISKVFLMVIDLGDERD